MAWPDPSPRRRWTLFALLAAIALLINLPVILMVLNSFQTTEQLTSARNLIPREPTLANYVYLNTRTSFWTYLSNSMIISLGSTVASAALAALAGYALSRYRGPVTSTYSRSLFVVQMFPIILALIPLFVLFRTLGLINSPLSVIILYTVVHLPFATWMARSFFDSIPQELEEAALIDGCSRWKAFLHITMPHLKNISIVLCLLMTIWTVNDFDTPWLLTQGGPANSTENLVLLAYRYTFGRNNVGMGSAISFTTLLILMVLIVLMLRAQRER